MVIDMRSTSQEELAKLQEKTLAIINKAAEDENQRWDSEAISVDIELVGDRPAGSQSAESVIVQTSLAADKALVSTLSYQNQAVPTQMYRSA